tara:strand:- start:19 stop:1473 length:1455 start_codon:yes stop_codon:yes gene_type:complete
LLSASSKKPPVNMIKVYFDWNVLSQIKNGAHSELKEILLNNHDLFVLFSSSHITDISASFSENQKQQELINSDLEFISELTENYCLYNNGKGIVCEQYPPKELFKQTIESKDSFKDLSIEGLMKTFEDDEKTNKIVKPLFDLLKNLPLDDSLKEAFKNPESAAIMENMFPGLKENPTMGGFFKSFSQMNINLNENDGYKELRQTIQNGMGINRDKIFNTENPFDLIDKSYDKLGITIDQFKNNGEHAPKWFNDISNEYIKLDMHGYQEDKVNIKKGRKETFKNTTEDAFHAAYASTCNFYVINDKRSYKKTLKVFEKLDINTRVQKPEEFLEFYKNFLGNKDPQTDLNIFQNRLESNDFYESEIDSGKYKTFYFPYFLFGYFNKLVTFHRFDENEEWSVFLSQDKPTNWFIIDKEIRILVNRLLVAFGPDINDDGPFKMSEFDDGKWHGRRWKMGEFTLRLIAVNNYVQLYWDLEMEKPADNNA